MAYANVKGHPGYVRDKGSGAILNINSNEIKSARARKRARQLEKEQQEQLQTDVNNLKQDIGEIKDLLSKILEVSNGNNRN